MIEYSARTNGHCDQSTVHGYNNDFDTSLAIVMAVSVLTVGHERYKTWSNTPRKSVLTSALRPPLSASTDIFIVL